MEEGTTVEIEGCGDNYLEIRCVREKEDNGERADEKMLSRQKTDTQML